MQVEGEAFHDLRQDWVILQQQIKQCRLLLDRMEERMSRLEKDYWKAVEVRDE